MVLIWALAWGIRRQGDLDHDLDITARRLRWLMVTLGLILAVLAATPEIESARLAIGGWLWATAFLSWPNFAYYLRRLIGLFGT